MECDSGDNPGLSAMEDQASPKLLPRVSISNIKSPSKRHLNMRPTYEACLSPYTLDWLPELKQFVSFFNIHFYVSMLAPVFSIDTSSA